MKLSCDLGERAKRIDASATCNREIGLRIRKKAEPPVEFDDLLDTLELSTSGIGKARSKFRTLNLIAYQDTGSRFGIEENAGSAGIFA